MALEIQWQRVFQLGGEGENFSVLALPPFFAAEGSKNIRLAKQGEAESILGYTTLNSTAITTDTGGDAVKVVGGTQYRTRSGTTTTRRDVVVVDDGTDEFEVYHSTDGGSSWSFLKDMGSGPVGFIPRFAQHGSSLFITMGPGENVQEYDGSSVADAGPTQPSAPSASVGTAAGALDGIYAYKQAEIDSNGDVGPASAATSKVVVKGKVVDLSSISTSGAGGTRIFRTTGDGGVFYTLVDITDGSTTFEDGLDDKTLLSRQAEVEDTGDAPPAGMLYCFTHRNRVFYMDNDTIYPSDFGKPDSVLSDASFKVGQGEAGDYTTGGTGEFGQIAVIWRERSVWTLSGDGRQTWKLRKTEAQAGAVSDRAVWRVPANATFIDEKGAVSGTGSDTLAYLTPQGDVRIFDGVEDRIISAAMADTFETMNHAHREKAFAFEYPPYEWIVWVFPAGSSTVPDTAIAWDYSRGSWHEVDFWSNLLCAWLTDSSSSANIVMAGEGETSTGGSVYQLFTGTDADGSNITNVFRTKPIDLQAPERVKDLRVVRSYYRALGSATNATLNTYTGFADTGASSFASFTQSMQKSNADVATARDEIKSSGSYPHSKAHVLEWTVTGQVQWALMGWTAGFQIRPESTWDPD